MDKKVIAALPLFADKSLNIYGINYGIEDTVEVGYSGDEETQECILNYDNEDNKISFEFNGETYYVSDFMRVSESADNAEKKKVSIYESLTDDEIESLSELDLTEDELSIVLNLLELIVYEKDQALALVKTLFEGKQLVEVEKPEEVEESLKFTKMLLGDK